MALDKNRLDKLENLIQLLNDSVTKEEFAKAFENVLKVILEIEKKLVEKHTNNLHEVKDLHFELTSNTQYNATAIEKELRLAIDRALKEQEIGMNFIKDKIRRIKEGANGKDGLDGQPGKDGSPDTPEQIRNKLEVLNGEERLRIEAINGLEERLKEIDARRALRGGGGFSKIHMDSHIIDDETPTGTINGSNKDFTTAGIPNPSTSLKVYLNGARQRIAEDYTLSKNTISFTVAPPTGSVLLVDYRV